jgi:hypothetical protein
MTSRGIILWLILLGATHSFAQDTTFPDFLSQYVRDNRMDGQESGVPVIIILNRTPDRCELVITMFALVSQVWDNLPADYTYINGQLLLIYNGSELLYTKNKEWQSSLRKAIGKQLCDNTSPTLPNHHGEVPIPCTFKYNPSEWKLVFTDGKLTHKEYYYVDVIRR